jgi:hypothetical protein
MFLEKEFSFSIHKFFSYPNSFSFLVFRHGSIFSTHTHTHLISHFVLVQMGLKKMVKKITNHIKKHGFVVGGNINGSVYATVGSPVPSIDFKTNEPQRRAVRPDGKELHSLVGSVMKLQLAKMADELNKGKDNAIFIDYRSSPNLDVKNGASYEYEFCKQQLDALVPMFFWTNGSKSFLSPSDVHNHPLYGEIPKTYKCQMYGYMYKYAVKDSKPLHLYATPNGRYGYLESDQARHKRITDWSPNVTTIYAPTKGPFSSPKLPSQLYSVSCFL